MGTALIEAWTVERFLAWEDRQEGRHEFDGACIVPMTGGSRAHQRIVYNLLRLLDDGLDPDRFDAVAEMRLDVGGKIRYPDVMVCAGRIPDQVRTLRDAVVVFEVLSEDTAATDRETKRAEYARVPSMRRYVLLEQSRIAATVLERAGGQWVEAHVAAGHLALPELGIALPLEEVYKGVAFLPSGSV
jgi:Uma2 family endonuclease